MLQPENPVAVTLDQSHVVGCEHEDLGFIDDFAYPLLAFFLKACIARGEHFIEQQDLWRGGGGHCKHQAHGHPRGVCADG